ncbi:MAG TPA: universal stress protein [Gemmatimonadaceae bacterium]|nr:universal stress protein [Gemmatimonadaceae bacterium]
MLTHADTPQTGNREAVPGAGQVTAREVPRVGRVLLATDGRPAADAACRLAQALATQRGATVEVLTVYEPRLALLEELVEATDDGAGEATELYYGVYTQLRRTSTRATVWPIRLEVGRPADTIARVARECGADLILVGLARHRPLDRLLGNETALQITRRARVPVLVVAPTLAGLPREALIALDFQPASVRSARAALALMDDMGTAHLAYVRTGMESVGVPAGGVDEEISRLLLAASDGLGATRTVRMEPVVLTGDPARSLMAFADCTGASGQPAVDLIVTGTHHRTPLERLAFGSVATKLLRAGCCSMLITPDALDARGDVPVPRAVSAEPAAGGGGPGANGWRAFVPPEAAASEWSRRMKEFSDRNASRTVELEVDDTELGAQHAVRGFELRGVTYDHRDGRVQIMLGDLMSSERHLTHSVSGVTAVDTLADEGGRDRALRIAHAAGQTLLTFAS